MQLSIGGTYIFTPGVPDISKAVSTEHSESGQPLKQTFTFSIKGVFKATSQADCKERELALVAAFNGENKDIILFMDDTNESAVVLKAAGSTTGIQIKDYSFPTTFGPECLTHRRFQFTAVATYPFGVNPDGTGSPQAQDKIATSWQESLRMSGGLPDVVFHLDINGEPPEKEITVPRTPYEATQSGSATGYLTYPDFPPPIFPEDLITMEQTPTSSPDGRTGWQIAWTYTFKSARPLRALPHFWRKEGLTSGN